MIPEYLGAGNTMLRRYMLVVVKFLVNPSTVLLIVLKRYSDVKQKSFLRDFHFPTKMTTRNQKRNAVAELASGEFESPIADNSHLRI